MTRDVGEIAPAVRTEDSEQPAVIVLGDAATLTRGSDNSSVESKQDPYD
ncbi:albusnodin family lasso peptide [Streptomyces coffeae]|uniref:Albusnodin family lasso peptide n=1 Tax=Streptomyces coffeae TaxID=621382 RepID=A0ABS1N5L9_9ACTN|nr:albusnodin family lasso peptide [Streptomyces coffeae]MBL1095374.1 albusnodin family lasso peptide [Streptomyces coffeae]